MESPSLQEPFCFWAFYKVVFLFFSPWNQGYRFSWKTIIYSLKFILNLTMYVKFSSTQWPAGSYSKVSCPSPGISFITWFCVCVGLSSHTYTRGLCKKHNGPKLLFYRRYLGIFNSLVKYFTQGITKYQNTILSLYNIFLLHCTPNKMKRGWPHLRSNGNSLAHAVFGSQFDIFIHLCIHLSLYASSEVEGKQISFANYLCINLSIYLSHISLSIYLPLYPDREKANLWKMMLFLSQNSPVQLSSQKASLY